MKRRRVLIVDVSNIFIRNYVINPSLGSMGQPVGGLVGTFKSLQKIARITNPEKIVMVYDGQGGSRKRKKLHKGYKSGRTPLRLNSSVTMEQYSDEQRLNNKIWQMTRLFEYCELTPIIQLIVDGTEADDIIAHVVHLAEFHDWEKIILSADKDFIQLLNKLVVLYRPANDEILNTKRVIEKYGISSSNFALARAIAGDKSDNIEGVPRAGLASLATRFPFLVEERECAIAEITNHCRLNEEKKIKLYDNILANVKKIQENYNLMQLRAPKISVQGAMEISNNMDKPPNFSRVELLQMMMQDGTNISLDDLFNVLKRFVNI